MLSPLARGRHRIGLWTTYTARRWKSSQAVLDDEITEQRRWKNPVDIPAYDGWNEKIDADFRKRIRRRDENESVTAVPPFLEAAEASASSRWAESDAVPKDRRSGICDSVLDLVGQTPLVRMSRLAAHLGLHPSIDLVAKLEYFNAGGSVKDRIGLRMIAEAERDGRIQPGDVLVEATSGNTGIGLGLAAAVKGYRVVVTMPEKMSGEKVNTMRALGAEILRTPTAAAWDAPDSHISVAAALAASSPDAHMLDQYANAGNPLAHYEETAAELLAQTRGELDVVVMAAGTGGTITGVGKRIKEALPHCQVVGVDPVGSILASPAALNVNGEGSAYEVEGIGYDFVPSVLDRSVVDTWEKVDDAHALAMARDLIRYEGALVGGSSGSAMAGALAYIERMGPALHGKRIAVLCPDSIRNYMTKFLDDEWMAVRGLPTTYAQVAAADAAEATSEGTAEAEGRAQGRSHAARNFGRACADPWGLQVRAKGRSVKGHFGSSRTSRGGGAGDGSGGSGSSSISTATRLKERALKKGLDALDRARVTGELGDEDDEYRARRDELFKILGPQRATSDLGSRGFI